MSWPEVQGIVGGHYVPRRLHRPKLIKTPEGRWLKTKGYPESVWLYVREELAEGDDGA